jgi:hypothetical protein
MVIEEKSNPIRKLAGLRFTVLLLLLVTLTAFFWNETLVMGIGLAINSTVYFLMLVELQREIRAFRSELGKQMEVRMRKS